jgi:class 3 adenylate cyclase
MLGALAGTPQVAGIGIVDVSGRLRRWSREEGAASADWSGRAEAREWLAQGAMQPGAAWRAPLWTPVKHLPALLHDLPLKREGRFIGMLGQVVTISRLSEELARFRAEHGVTPFILYGEDAVLAHPLLAQEKLATRADPLVGLTEVGDPVLARLHSPEAWQPFEWDTLRRAGGGHLKVDGNPYIYLQRRIEGYGPQPWTIGVYLDPVSGGQRAQMQGALGSIAAGLAVLLVAVLTAALVGRRLARPVEALARAARAVRAGELDQLPRVPPSAIAEFDEARRSFEEMVAGLRERKLMRDTLGQYVPEQIARRLLAEHGKLEPVEAKATILMCDIEGFAALTDSLGPRRVFDFVNAYFEAIVASVERYGGVITQFQGDAILAVFNLPLPDRDHAAQALRAALEIVQLCDERRFAGVAARNRIGLSTGRVVAGAVGSPGRLSYTVHGNAVNLAARIELLNKEYGTRILLSGKTAERCPGFALRKVADAQVRGYAEAVPLYTPAG